VTARRLTSQNLAMYGRPSVMGHSDATLRGRAPADKQLIQTAAVDMTDKRTHDDVQNDLTALNRLIGEMEQAGGDDAKAFFGSVLSDRLVFRRASGATVGKSGDQGFLSGLDKNPFSWRESEDISVTELGDRALVTLMVVGKFAADGSIRRYRNIRLFSRVSGSWQLEFWYNFEITAL